MRTVLFAGKGGTGKTSLAAATGLRSAAAGQRTLVMSLDPAHSLSDAFDLPQDLLQATGQCVSVAENLWIQELNINLEISRHWAEIFAYITALLSTAGLEGVVAEEIAVLPGMEETTALLYINQYAREKAFDALILDCAPTAESMRFVSLPTALNWYMDRIFTAERHLLRVARPVAKRLISIPLPEDDYFACIERIHQRLEGVQELLTDSRRTTVRLVTNPEKMVLRETQRAAMYFALHGLAVEAVLVNRVWPEEKGSPFMSRWTDLQRSYQEMVQSLFAPLPIIRIPLLATEVLGLERLRELGQYLPGGADPLQLLYSDTPLQFVKRDGLAQVRVHLPFAKKEDVELHKVRDELVAKIGVFRKHIALPHAFASSQPTKARFESDYLVIDFEQPKENQP